MLLLNFWIPLNIFFDDVLATSDAELPAKRELQEMRRAWEKCCKNNLCIHHSCYTIERKASGWAAMRQRCQSQYPDWPYASDIFQIQNEEDIQTLWNILFMPSYSSNSTEGDFVLSAVSSSTVWTSGTRCPRTSTEGTILITRWVSTNDPFPDWLEGRVNDPSFRSEGLEDNCKFLVVLPTPNYTDVQYDFQDENARHAAICEFLFPDDFQPNTTSSAKETTYVTRTSLSTVTDTTQSETSFSFSPSQATTLMKSKTLEPAGGKFANITSSAERITSERVTKEPQLTTKPRRFCRGKIAADILWPDTEPDSIANVSCPDGMSGYAQWTCNGKTLDFTPEKPHIQDCRHIWIEEIERDVKERNDAVAISSKLSIQTRNKTMSHGDITALVDLSAKILLLYYEQKGEEEFEISFQEKPPVSYIFTQTMVSAISNILRANTKKAWEVLPEIHQTREATKILKIVTSIGSRLSCIRKSSDKLQFTVSAENIDMQTFIFNNAEISDEERVVFPHETEKVKSSSLISLPSNLHLRVWSSPCRRYHSAVGIMYNHVGDFLKDEKISNSNALVATKVISFSLSNDTETISLPEGDEVFLTLQHVLQQGVRGKVLQNPRCVFWNFSKKSYGQWDSSGCHLITSNETHTLCKCNHLTNFAVLMDINNNIEEDGVISMMTYICCGISSLTLILTLICFSVIRALHGRRSIITGNLCLSLLISNLLVLFGLDQTENKVLCSIIAGFLHFWILSAFCWMLVEGYHLYRMVILVFQRGSIFSVKFYYFFAYGIPAIVVGISAGLRSKDYVGANYCWLSANNGLMWSFVGPACVIILVNLVIFIMTLRSASSVRLKREQSTIKKIKSWVRGSMSVMCLLGLTWCLGLFYIDKKLHVFSYVFTILNGLQGVFIFLFHILLNDKVNSTCFLRCKEKKQDGRRKFPNRTSRTSSNPLHSRTSNRTSMNSIGCMSMNNPVTSLKSRAMTPQSYAIQPKDFSRNLTNGIEDIPRFKRHHFTYRKNKATHTLSENELNRSSLYSQRSKSRSHSLPEEKGNISRKEFAFHLSMVLTEARH